MIKLVVGLKTLEDFIAYQERDRLMFEGAPANPVWTRHKPKRDQELMSGGSIYRVIDGRIRCRQEIIGFTEAEDPHKGKMCVIMVSPEIILTVAQPHRPFQGWRYFDQAKAPRDLGPVGANQETPPADMEQELRDAGLL